MTVPLALAKELARLAEVVCHGVSGRHGDG